MLRDGESGFGVEDDDDAGGRWGVGRAEGWVGGGLSCEIRFVLVI